MTERRTTVTLGPKFFLPFLIGDLLLLGAAFLIWQQANRPMTAYEVGAFAGCVALGAWLGVWPFRLRQEAELQLAETAELSTTLAQIERVEDVAQRIDTATGQWQTAQEHAARTMTAAREITDRMAAEQREFHKFMEKAQDAERNNLRLEVNKLRRAEGDWLQVLVRVLDHVYALYLAGVRSGQPHLIEQFTQFQNACRDAARRVGLVAITAAPDSTFDAEVHQLPDPSAAPPEGSTVAETIGTGFAFQGQLLRRAVVVINTPAATAPTPLTSESFSNLPEPAPMPDSSNPTEAAPTDGGSADPAPAPATAPPTEEPSVPGGEPLEPATPTEPPAEATVPATMPPPTPPAADNNAEVQPRLPL